MQVTWSADLTTGKHKTILLAVGLIVLAAVVQIWVVSGGTWRHGSFFTRSYSELADGFLEGHLNIDIQPKPELLALPNPYDPLANEPYRFHDASLYHGKYYYYWGPVPAVLIAGVSRVIGVARPMMGDQYLVLAFALGATIFAVVLIFEMRARLFADQRPSTAIPAVLSLAIGAPMLFSLSRPGVYETAILAGQFFLLAGLWAAWRAVTSAQPRLWPLLAAGVLWTLAIGSRISLPPAVAAVTILTLWQLRSRPAAAARYLALLAPPAIGAVLLGWYNWVRFDSVFETGARYQLAGIVQTSLVGSNYFSLSHLLPNVLAYLLTLPGLQNTFPYLIAVDARPWLSKVLTLPTPFNSEPLAGLLWTLTFLIFIPWGIAAAWRTTPSDSPPERSPVAWLVFSLLAASLLGLILPLALPGVTLRYLMDGVPCLSILALIGYWRILRKLAPRPRAAHDLRLVVNVVVILECVVGILIAVSRNPVLFQRTAVWFGVW